MKRSEFVPGVLFMMPGYNLTKGGKIFHVESIGNNPDSATGFSCQGILYNGTFLPQLPGDYEFHHLKLKSNGIQIWDVVSGVYLYSKVIPFSHLTKVYLPVTNPQSI